MSADFGDVRLPANFWSKVEQSSGGCWIWIAGKNSAGYGLFSVVGRRKKLAHRLTFEALVSAIPAGLDIDHLCRVRDCCNPAHLEPVTRGENIRRGLAPTIAGRRQLAKTHCPRGHELANENLYVSGGKRHCRACRRAQSKASDARRRVKETP